MNYKWHKKAPVLDNKLNYGPGREGSIGLCLELITAFGSHSQQFGYIGFGNPDNTKGNPVEIFNPPVTIYDRTNEYFLSDLMQYDPFTNIWTALWIGDSNGMGVGPFVGKQGPVGRRNPFAFGLIINQRSYIYVGGGTNNYVQEGSGWLNDLWVFDIQTREWTEIIKKSQSLYPGRLGGIGFGMNGKGYFGLGYYLDNAGAGHYLNDFWQFDPANPTHLLQLKAYPESLCFASGFIANNSIYIGAGQEKTGAITKKFFAFDGSIWTSQPALPLTLQSTTGLSNAGKGYIGMASGQPAGFYKLDGSSWQALTILGAAPIERGGAVGFSLDGHIYTGTGFSNPNYLNDFWSIIPED